MRRLLAFAALTALVACRPAPRDPNTVVVLIESSPSNLDPRIGLDVQSQRIDALLFDGLVARDASFDFTPARRACGADRPFRRSAFFIWRCDVRLPAIGCPLTAEDVKWTLSQ